MPKPPPTILDTALKLFDRGLWIVPCNGKGPFWQEWHTRKRTRDELLSALKDSKCNIALVLNQSELIDAECDTPEAEKALQAMFGGEIPATPTWQSRRGKHRLFRRPPDLPERAVIEIDGVEFKIGNGKGAAAVIPPSVHPDTGKRYCWVKGLSLDDVKPADLPLAVVDRLRMPSTDNGIPEGKRNQTLFSKATQLRLLGLPEDMVVDNLVAINARLCRPPLPEAEVRTIAQSAASGDSKVGSDFVAELLREIELWHDENDEPFATIPQGEHRENWLIGSRARPFRRWISKRYYDKTNAMLPSAAISDIASMLEGKAVFDGAQHRLFRRTAQHDSAFYLDLCEPEWKVVAIDADGWRVMSNPPVKFRRAKAMHSLPVPVTTSGFELHDLLCPFLNIREDQWPLVMAWLVAALRPVGPYPVLKLLGEQGSAKTTTARVLRSLVDPNAAPVRAEPRSTRDLMIATHNGWVICLDNLSMIKADLSDALCRLSTGGGFATRTLYTDDEESIFEAMRPVILTSIEEIGTRSDLLERSLIIELPAIADADRRAEKPFWHEFDRARPRILGALLDIVSGAIRRLPEIERRDDPELPRLADFYAWGEAAETSAGLEPGTFAEAYTANRESAAQVALDSSPVMAVLLSYLVMHNPVEETAASLLEHLECIAGNAITSPYWPRGPRVLSAKLKLAAPNLRQIGVTAVQDTRGGGNRKEKIWVITAAPDVVPVVPSDTTQSTADAVPARHLARKKGRKGRKGRKYANSFRETWSQISKRRKP